MSTQPVLAIGILQCGQLSFFGGFLSQTYVPQLPPKLAQELYSAPPVIKRLLCHNCSHHLIAVLEGDKDNRASAAQSVKHLAKACPELVGVIAGDAYSRAENGSVVVCVCVCAACCVSSCVYMRLPSARQ